MVIKIFFQIPKYFYFLRGRKKNYNIEILKKVGAFKIKLKYMILIMSR